MNLEWLLLRTFPEKEEEMWDMTDEAAAMDLWEERKQAMDILSEAINWVCYLTDADFCDLEELHQASAGK